MFKAELRTTSSIWAWMNTSIKTTNKSDFLLIGAQGTEIPLAKVLPHTAKQILIIPAQPSGYYPGILSRNAEI